jgi:hypothetical protein
VHPDLRPVPRRRVQGLLPGAEGGRTVDAVAELLDRPAYAVVELGQRAAPAAGPSGERAGGVDPPQRGDERGEVDGRPVQVVDAAVGVLAGQPFVHRPGEGVALGGLAHRQRDGQREREMRGEPGQPLGFLGRLPGGPADPGQPDGQPLTESVDVVVRSVRGDQPDRQVGPVRELPGEQSAYQVRVGLDLVGVHLHGIHRGHPRPAAR